jgi:hypothetical protein
MSFEVDDTLLQSARGRLSSVELTWIVGGAGSGKSTVCRALERRGHRVIDLDGMIYGTFHGRFDPSRHPANVAWTSAASSLGFLLSMSWAEFDAFHRAALVEYLDLLAGDLQSISGPIVLDGGAWHPSVLVRAIPSERVVCIVAPHLTSTAVWEADGRLQMREYMNGMPNADAVWMTFLEYDSLITRTVSRESEEAGVRVLTRHEHTTPDELADQVIVAISRRSSERGAT